MFWGIFLACVAIDQISKYLIVSNLSLGEMAPFLGSFMQFKYILNTGASFSILEGYQWLFIVLTILVTIVVIYLYYKSDKADKIFRICLAVFLGGVWGNFIDRIRQGAVIDFFYTGWFATFNVADCFINISVFAIIAMLLFGKLGKKLK